MNHLPKLRFKEFTEAYTHTTLGDIAIFLKGKGISKSELVDNGDIECITYGELYTTYKENISTVYSRTSGRNLVFSEKNDVITPASGETPIDLATASYLTKAGIALGGDINIIRTKQNGLYLSYYLNSKRKIDFAKLGQGHSVVHIYSNHLKNLELLLPKNICEQEKVANFLSKIDDKISFLEEKLTYYKNYKKKIVGLMINKFRNEYNQSPLCNHIKEKNKGCNPQYNPNGENILICNEYISDKNKKVYVDNQIDVEFNDVLILWDGSNAGTAYTNLSGVCGSTFACLKLLDINNDYLVEYMNNDIKKIQSITEGSGVPHVPKDFLKYYKIAVPPLNIQKEFSNDIANFNKKIEWLKEQLENVTLFRKALLQQMFI